MGQRIGQPVGTFDLNRNAARATVVALAMARRQPAAPSD